MEDKSLPPTQLIRPKGESESLEGADANVPVSSYSSHQEFPIESLEVHTEGERPLVSGGLDAGSTAPTNRSVPFSRRRATLVSLVITALVVLATVAVAFMVFRRGPEKRDALSSVPTQDVSFDAVNGLSPSELQGAEASLLVNGDIITRGVIKVRSGNFFTTLRSTELTANQIITMPNASGTICLDSNNCSSASQAQFTQLQTQVNQLVIPGAGVTNLNDQTGAITIQGSLNRIAVTTSGGDITITTPQDLDANANVQFNSLTVNATGEIKGNFIRQTGAGNDITIDAAGDNVVLVDGGRTFVLPGGGGATQTVCTTQGNCGGGGATPVILAPGVAQTDSTADASIFINDTGGGSLIQLQSGGVDRLVVAPSGDTTIGGTLTVSGLGSGVVRSTGGLLSVGLVNLATEVTGTLTVTNGGTGAASLTANGVLVGNGASAITSVVSGGAGLCLISNVGAPSWQACPGGGGVTTLNAMAGAITVQGTANQINVVSGAGLITLSTPQDIATTSDVQFDALDLTGYMHSSNSIDIDTRAAIGNGTTEYASNATADPSKTLLVTNTFNSGIDCLNGCAGVMSVAEMGSATNPSMLSAYRGAVNVDAGRSLTAATGLFVETPNIEAGGSIGVSYGVYVDTLNNAGSNIGIYVQSASTYGIWIDGGLSRFDNGVWLEGGTPLEIEGATNDTFGTTIGVVDPTADRTILFPNQTGTVCLNTGNCVGAGGSAPNAATYLVTTLDPTLTNERAVIAGTNISLADGGAGGNFTIATVDNPIFSTSVTTPLLTSTGALTVTPGGVMTLGATGQTALLQGSTASITSTGAGNDITLTSADQIILNAGSTIALQDNTNITGHLGVGTGTAGPNAVVGINETFDSGYVCGGFGCYGSLILVTANNPTGLNDGVAGMFASVSTAAAGFTLDRAVAVVAGAGVLGGGSAVGENVGVLVENQTKGTNDYGVWIQGADTYALWVDSGISRFDGNLEFEGSTDDAFEFTLAVADPTADRTYTIPNSSAATDTFCLVTLGNCAGSGGGVTGSGTNNRVAKFTSTGSTIGDSTLTDDGTNVSTTGDITIQGGDATVGTTSQVGSLILNDGSSNTATITTGAFAGNRIYTLPDVGGNADICLNTGNCAGSGGGITGTGTNNTLTKFTGTGTVGNSSVTDNGTTVAVGAALNVSGNTDLAGTLFVGTADAFQVSSSGAVTAVGINAGGAISGVTTLTASGTINTTGGVLQTNSTTRVDNSGNLTNIGNITGTGGVTIASAAGGDVIIDGADEFVVQDAAVFNAQSSFNSDVDVVLTDSENWSVGSTITGTTSVSVLNMAVTNNTSSGTQNLALLQNAAGSGVTDGLLVLDNADSDTAVSGAIIVTSAAGGITNAIDVSDIDITNALLFGANDIIGTNFTIAGATGATTIGSAIQQGTLTLHDGDGQTATISVGSALATNTALAIPTTVSASDTFCLLTLANCAGSGTNSFQTISVPAGTNPQAASGTDTLTLAVTGTNLTVTGNSGTDTITFDIVESALAGNGLVANSNALDVNTGNGLELNSDAVRVNQDFSFGWTADHTWTLSNTEDLAVSSTLTGTNAADVFNLTITNQTSSGTQRGIVVSNANDAANATTEALLVIDNAETTANSVTDYLLLTTASTDTTTDAIDVSDSDFFNAINVDSNFILGNGIRQFSSSATVWTFEDTSGNDLLTVTDAGTTGNLAVTGNTTLTGTLQVNGNSTIGNANTDTLTINGTTVSIPNDLDFGRSESLLFLCTTNGSPCDRKIGIGTTSPGARLHIVQKADGINEGLRVKDSGGNSAVNIYYNNPGALAFIDVVGTYQMGHITSLAQSGQLNAGRLLTLKSFNESSLGGISFDIGGSEIARFNTNNQLVLSNGAAGTPALSFLSDADTGVYRGGADDLRLAAGGQSQLRATVNGIFIEERLVLGVDTRTIASTGDASPAALTLNPNSSYVEITCNDPDTCDITMDEAAPVAGGQAVYVVNVSANIVDFADTAGVTELAGACAASQYDTLSMLYVDAAILRWVELSRSNNSGVGGCA
ncbi:MAG TPA: hypothetical protein VK694_07275 [Verrucomicrobiae bacterium]|nr:hypothetical protein [Verrucomicrobiae bacterium]